jgi:polar amino acid transport system permease protein
MKPFMNDILFIGKGVVLTVQLLTGGLVLGMLLGLLFSFMHHRHLGRRVITIAISVIRGTPLILQLSLIYFAVPTLLGVKLDVVTSGIIAFGINSSAYIAEIIRAGIESIPKGQFEAAKTLAVPQYYMWKDIIFPQVIRAIFPSMINEVIALLKETALIGTISGLDIMRLAQILGAQQFTYFAPLCIAAVYYYCLVLAIEYAGKWVEKGRWYAKN